MKKMRRRLLTLAAIGVLVVSNIMITSAKTTTKTDKYNAYSVVGLNVCHVKFTVEGDKKKHTISNYYKSEESTAIFNSVENEKKWVSKVDKKKKAQFSARHKCGIPTPWGTIGYTFKNIYLSATF